MMIFIKSKKKSIKIEDNAFICLKLIGFCWLGRYANEFAWPLCK